MTKPVSTSLYDADTLGRNKDKIFASYDVKYFLSVLNMLLLVPVIASLCPSIFLSTFSFSDLKEIKDVRLIDKNIFSFLEVIKIIKFSFIIKSKGNEILEF